MAADERAIATERGSGTDAGPPEGERLCPGCGEADRIEPSKPLWPTTWRCAKCAFTPAVHAGVVCLAPELDGQLVGFNSRFHAFLANVEDGHFWFEERNRLISWLLRRLARRPARILEVGCGTGFVLKEVRRAFPAASVAGSELHSGGVSVARDRHGADVELIQMDARRLHLREALDLVCAFDVVEHIEEDEAAIASIHQALRPGGYLVATVPQHPWLWSASDDIGHHARRYQPRELQQKVCNAGFQILYSDSFTSLLLPLMALVRVGEKVTRRTRLSDEEIIEREFRIAPRINTALRRVLWAEHALRQFGVRYFAGGSRVIIAVKPSQNGDRLRQRRFPLICLANCI